MTRMASHSCHAGQRFGLQQAGGPAEEVRRADHNFLPLVGVDPGGVEPGAEQGEQGGCFLGGLEVVGLLRVPQGDVVPVVGSQAGFEGHHPGRRRLGDPSIPARVNMVRTWSPYAVTIGANFSSR